MGNYFPDTTGYLVSGSWLRAADEKLSQPGFVPGGGNTLHGLIVPVYVLSNKWTAVSNEESTGTIYQISGRFIVWDGPNQWRIADEEYPIWSYVKSPIHQGMMIHAVYRGWWELLSPPAAVHFRGVTQGVFIQNAWRDEFLTVLLPGGDLVSAKSPLSRPGDTFTEGTRVILSRNLSDGELEVIQVEC